MTTEAARLALFQSFEQTSYDPDLPVVESFLLNVFTFYSGEDPKQWITEDNLDPWERKILRERFLDSTDSIFDMPVHYNPEKRREILSGLVFYRLELLPVAISTMTVEWQRMFVQDILEGYFHHMLRIEKSMREKIAVHKDQLLINSEGDYRPSVPSNHNWWKADFEEECGKTIPFREYSRRD